MYGAPTNGAGQTTLSVRAVAQCTIRQNVYTIGEDLLGADQNAAAQLIVNVLEQA